MALEARANVWQIRNYPVISDLMRRWLGVGLLVADTIDELPCSMGSGVHGLRIL